MSSESLEAAIKRAGSPVQLLRHSRAPAYTFPVAGEFTNWRSEQRAWRETCALFDQSHHMTDLYLSGRDAMELLNGLGVNTFKNFDVGRAKQFVAVNDDGYVIGDAILFRLDAEHFDLVGHPMVLDWVHYNLEVGGYQAGANRDDNSFVRRSRPPQVYRYELQGPSALEVIERATGQPAPAVKFFHTGELTIAGRRLRALRHGMAGQSGFELFGPWADGDVVLEALLEAGRRAGLVRVGAKAYSTANLESGWVPTPLPAIYSGERLAGYREWLRADDMGSLGGSYASDDIADYYLTPFELGYRRHVAFDHDFVGRAALEKAAETPSRTKVTLVWDRDDVTAAVHTLYEDGLAAKYLDMPKARYALFQADRVEADGQMVGISMDCGYVYNERAMLSLATIDPACAVPGTPVTVVWGEDPNSTKPQVEPHRQVRIRATVAPAPYVEYARSAYRSA